MAHTRLPLLQLTGAGPTLSGNGLAAMLAISDLDQIAQARLVDAQALAAAGRFDGALYLCGYAVEIALKARICKTLNWAAFPETSGEFQSLTSFKTHDLGILLKLSGLDTQVRTNHFAEWSVVEGWRPESRYKQIGTGRATDATDMINATITLLSVL